MLPSLISHPLILSVSWCFLSLDVSLSLLFSFAQSALSPPLPPSLLAHLAGWGRGDLWGVGGSKPGLLFTFCVTKNLGESGV